MHNVLLTSRKQVPTHYASTSSFVQIKALCCNSLGGVPSSYLSSQQTATEAIAVKNELKKVTCQSELFFCINKRLSKPYLVCDSGGVQGTTL